MLLLIHVAGTGIVRLTVDQRSCATLDEQRKAGAAGLDELLNTADLQCITSTGQYAHSAQVYEQDEDSSSGAHAASPVPADGPVYPKHIDGLL